LPSVCSLKNIEIALMQSASIIDPIVRLSEQAPW
jgi:hypothetical protein